MCAAAKDYAINKMGTNQQIDIDLPRNKSDVSPGMLRRRYSVPETIMRKYRLAQQRSDSDDSGTATAPSPAHRPASPASPASPSRSPSRVSCVSLQESRTPRNRCALRDREIMRRSTLLRRLWSRQGVAGPYASSGELRSSDCCTQGCQACYSAKIDMTETCKACEINANYSDKLDNEFSTFDKSIGGPQHELRYYSKMPSCWSPLTSVKPTVAQDGGCECCKKLYQSTSKENRNPYSISFSGRPRSPKRQRLDSHCGINRSNEMLRTAMRNSYEKMEESHKQKEALSDSVSECTIGVECSNSVSIPSASTTISSSLRTTDNGIASSPVRTDTSSEISSSYSKSSPIHSRSSNDANIKSKDRPPRPSTTGSNILNLYDKVPTTSNVKKRRQSVCIYMNAFESPVAEIKSESFTDSYSPADITLDENTSVEVLANGNQSNLSLSSTTATNTLVSEEQIKSISSNDSNGNMKLITSSELNQSSPQSDSKHQNSSKESDSTLSEQYPNSTDNYILGELLPDMNINNKIVNNEVSKYDLNNIATKKSNLDKESMNVCKSQEKRLKKSMEATNIEFLEIVVSETLNSTAFLDNFKNNNVNITIPEKKEIVDEYSKSKNNVISKPFSIDALSGNIDLDEYVSFVLIESLNSMTEQLEEINASVDKDKQLNIVEKEIKVKLQSASSSPIADIVIDKVFLEKVGKSPMASQNTSRSLDLKLKEKPSNTEVPNEVINGYLSEEIKYNSTNNADDTIYNQDNNLNVKTENNNNMVVDKNTTIQNNTSNQNNGYKEEVEKFVMQQIQQIIENDLKSDPNLNYTSSSAADTYPSVSHIEISNIDVYIENLPKLSTLDTVTTQSNNVGALAIEESTGSSLVTDIIQDSINSNSAIGNSNNIITNVGTATYYKPTADPVFVPRYSAYPLSDSMEVNTSSEDEIMKESDAGSLVDSLEDPNSPRLSLNFSKVNNHDKKLARGDIITLLPENSQRECTGIKSPVEKSESFFITIKDNECNCQKETIIVANHMPESLKEKLLRRQRKRELRMEHIKRKRLRHIKREYEKQKRQEALKANQAIEQDCVTIMKRLLDQVTEKIKDEERHSRCCKNSKEKEIMSPRKSNQIKNSKISNKVDLKKLETFKIDKFGNTCYQQPVLQNKDYHSNQSNGSDNVNSKGESNSTAHSFTPNKSNESDNDRNIPQTDTSLSPDLLGPKRIYHKSEFHEGNKKVEILEILECNVSSPECLSDDNDYSKMSKWQRRSKIPIPIYEKLHRSPRNKLFQKSTNLNVPDTNRTDCGLDKCSSKVDQLIANILIDALKDKGMNKNKINFVNSPRQNNYDEFNNNFQNAVNTTCRRASVPLQESPTSLRFRALNTPRYTQKFEIIPEEKSSLSIESSVEDANLTRRISLPTSMTNNERDIIENQTKYTLHTNDHVGNTIKSSPVKRSILKSNSPKHTSEDKFTTMDEKIRTTGSPLMKILKSACTSPISSRKSAATSPIPHLYGNTEITQDKQVKVFGKKSLSSKGTRDGWIGFCRPNSRTPEEEGIVKSPDVIHCTVKAHR